MKTERADARADADPLAQAVDRFLGGLATQSKERQSVRRALEELRKAASGVDPRKLGAILEKHGPLIASLVADGEAVVRDLRNRIDEEAAYLMQSFPVDLTNAAEQAGLRVQRDGDHFYFHGVVYTQVDLIANICRLNGRSLKTTRVPALIQEIRAEMQRVRAETEAPQDFIEKLAKAYDHAIGTARTGSQAAIFDVLRELVDIRQSKAFWRDPAKSKFKPYPLEVFRADLVRLQSELRPMRTKGGRTLRLEHGSFSADALYLYYPDLNTYRHCGRLSFVEAIDE